MGVSVGTLTCARAEDILRKELRWRYQDGEHLKIWRERMRDAQLEAELVEEFEGLTPRGTRVQSVVEAGSINKFVTDYRERVLRHRLQNRRALDAKWRRRKAYRYNPWL